VLNASGVLESIGSGVKVMVGMGEGKMKVAVGESGSGVGGDAVMERTPMQLLHKALWRMNQPTKVRCLWRIFFWTTTLQIGRTHADDVKGSRVIGYERTTVPIPIQDRWHCGKGTALLHYDLRIQRFSRTWEGTSEV
jgi:hypothetical protein